MTSLPNPSNFRVSFDTIAELTAATIPDGVLHVFAAGLMYVTYDGSNEAATSNGGAKKWAPPVWDVTPLHWGAAGDGATDDQTAINTCFTWAKDASAHSDLIGPKAVVDGRGRQYALASGVTIPAGADGMVFRDFSFLAVGNGWNPATDYLVTNSATYSDFYSIALNCDHKCRGWNDSTGSGRVRHWSPQIYKMAEVGYHKSAGGGEIRMFGGQITQYLTTDPAVDTLAEESNYNAIGILIDESDCKIHNTNVRWCGTCYQATAGIQEVHACHFVQGTAGLYGRTNGELVKWGNDDGSAFSGEIWFKGCYFDNGYLSLYDDQVNFQDCKVLLDTADADVDAMFRFYAYSGAGEPQATASLTFSQWDDTADLLDWRSNGAFAWSDDFSGIKSRLSSILSGGTHQEKQITLSNTDEHVSTNANGAAKVFNSTNLRALTGYRDRNSTTTVNVGSQGDSAYIGAADGLIAATPGIEMTAQSAEPPNLGNGSIAVSDGTASTNGFGGTGAGLYLKLSGTWSQL